MGLLDFVKGVYHQANPFDSGRTYSSHYDAKRKREEEEERRRNNQASRAPSAPSTSSASQEEDQRPERKKTVNIFEDLNKDLVFNKPQNAVDVIKSNKTKPLKKPKPGDLIQSKRKKKINRGLDAGKSWEDISRETGTPLKDVQRYSKSTRPEYGIDVKRDTASNVSNLEKIKRYGLPSFGEALKDTAQDVARSVPRLGQEARDVFNKEERVKPYDPSRNKVSRFFFGERPVVPSTQEGQEFAGQFSDSRKVKKTAGTANLLLDLADVFGVGSLLKSGVKGGVRRIVGSGDKTPAETAGPRPVSTQKNIPIDSTESLPQSVGVRSAPSSRPIIRELGGDASEVTVPRTRAEVTEQRAADRFRDQAPGRPDQRIEGVGAVDTGTTSNFFTRTEINNERVALDEALDNKQINKTQHKEANKELDKIVAVDDVPEGGRKIEVKKSETISTPEETVVPRDLPETPGAVRATSKTEPTKAKSEVIAAETPPALPRETQAILDNPKQFNKRQVAAARNQRKMAKQVAKAQEDTSEALGRIETASPAAQSGEGFVPTGQFGRSSQGGAYQKASRSAEAREAIEETSQLSPADVIQTARKNQLETGGFNRRDIRNVAALFESKRIPRGTQEWDQARAILKEDGTIWGQQGALRNYSMRRNSSSDELVSRYESKIYRLADDPEKIDSKWFDEVEVAEEAYVQARDDALLAYNRFTESPTSANAKAYHAAQDAAEKAEKNAKVIEYRIAEKALKGNKDTKQVRELEKLANDADVYQMDHVDASMLSGTGTFTRNLVNAAVSGVEESIFGKPAAFLARNLTKESVGGGVGRGSGRAFKGGASNLVDASKARSGAAGKNPLEHVKNWATTGNEMGNTIFDAQASKNTLDHYAQMLKGQGYKGQELKNRASVMARQDPDNVGRVYSDAARVASGLGGGITRSNRLETFVKNMVSDVISGGNPSRTSEGIAKLITRLTVGFPTAIGRSVKEGVKRFTLGAPTFFKAAKSSDPQMRAILIKEGIKQAGSGSAIIPPLFYALGASGAITGAYPDSDEERAQWERDGITENAIKIGDAYYQLPAYLGAWAVPGLFYASLGRNGGNFGEATADVAKSAPDLLPTGGIESVLDVVSGRRDIGRYLSQLGPGAVRATTPAGALLNQLAKSFDSTRNDTTSGSNIENAINRILGGIPGVNNMAGIPDKTDDAGNIIENPNAGELLFGAQTASQEAGEQRSADIQAEADSALKSMADTGALNDPNLEEILEGDDLALYNKAKSGEKLEEGELEDLQEALVRGVSQEGTDTAYLEREQYDTNLAALKIKRDLVASDKTVKPSTLEDLDVAIKRGEVYKENQIPYDMIKGYQDTSLTEWRDMGDPEDEDYNPEMYEKLWQMDQIMTKAGVSDNYKGQMDKNKYSSESSGSGRGGRGGSKKTPRLITDFGTLDEGPFSPRVQEYETIDQQSGGVPVIRRERPNIVHKISSSG